MSDIPGLVVILGSPNDENGNLSAMGKGRVELGYKKYLELKAAGWKILLTGGFGAHFNTTKNPNAYYAQQMLLQLGVSATDILDFALSKNTVDDALQSREIIEKFNYSSLVVVSSDFHIPRVEFVFKAVFPDCSLTFAAAPYLEFQSLEERDRLLAHESKELESLKERGESIVGGALNINSWRKSTYECQTTIDYSSSKQGAVLYNGFIDLNNLFVENVEQAVILTKDQEVQIEGG